MNLTDTLPAAAAIPERRAAAAIVCAGGESTSLGDAAFPEPGPGEMTLRMQVSGFCGTDLFKLKTGAATPGMVLGHEIVGTVEKLGAGVDAFQPGDRVVVPHHVACGSCHLCLSGAETMCPVFKENLMAPGGFADFILIRARAVEQAARRVPDHVTDAQAVFMEPGACVLRGIDRSGLADGGSAAILGAGSMGLLHLLILRAAIPGMKVLVIDFEEDRLALARDLGAAAIACPGEEATDAAMRLTEGRGVDAVFDTVGGARTLAAGIDMARAGGSIVLFAHAGDGEKAAFDLNALFKKEQRVIATYSGALDEQRRVFDLIVAGALDPTPLVTHTLPLEEFQHGVDLTVRRKALKVLFTPSAMAVAAE